MPSFDILTDAPLLHHNTFGIQSTAERLIFISNPDQLQETSSQGLLRPGLFIPIGSGSNIVFGPRCKSLILVIQNKGLSIVSQDSSFITIRVAAGEIWHNLVQQSIQNGWHGLENLIAIPGTVGAAAVQNIGAYGSEAKDSIVSVDAWDTLNNCHINLSNEDCHFAYRNSYFKSPEGRRLIVTSVTFKLTLSFSPILSYGPLRDALGNNANPNAQTIASTIENLRWSKLPHPEEIGSAGSFFKNPVVTKEKYDELKLSYPDIVAYPAPNGFKLSAGWLIDHCGWKGKSMGHCGVYDKQALVLVNHGGCTGTEVKALADAIASDIKSKYGIHLDYEAEFIGF